MKKVSTALSLLLLTLILFSCGGGLGTKTYFVKYTDKNDKEVSFGNNDINYSYWSPTHENSFFIEKKVVKFQIDDSFTPENIVGKTINIMIMDEKNGESADFDIEKSIKCKVDGFDFVKKGMFDDKVYKLTGTFNTDEYKNGKLSLQVFM